MENKIGKFNYTVATLNKAVASAKKIKVIDLKDPVQRERAKKEQHKLRDLRNDIKDSGLQLRAQATSIARGVLAEQKKEKQDDRTDEHEDQKKQAEGKQPQQEMPQQPQELQHEVPQPIVQEVPVDKKSQQILQAVEKADAQWNKMYTQYQVKKGSEDREDQNNW